MSFFSTPTTGIVQRGVELKLPRWISAFSHRGSILRGLFEHFNREVADQVREARSLNLGLFLSSSLTNEDSYIWSVPLYLPQLEQITVTVTTPLGSFPIHESPEPSYFWRANAPSWQRGVDGSEGSLWLRALHYKTQLVYSATSSFTISGDTLAPGWAIYYRQPEESNWEVGDYVELLASGSVLALPASGYYTLALPSLSLLTNLVSGTATVTRTGGTSNSLPLDRVEQHTALDGFGKIAGLARFDDEDNVTYWNRLLADTQCQPNLSTEGLIRSLAVRLGLVSRVVWDGLSSLSFPSASGLTTVYLQGYPTELYVNEELQSDGSGVRFYGTYSNWLPGWRVLNNGVPTNQASVSGNLVSFASVVSGSVLASYRVAQYNLGYTDGYITSLVAGQGIPSGSYTVFFTRSLTSYPADLEWVRESKLLDSVGLPTLLLHELQANLRASSNTSYHNTRWSAEAYWRDDSDIVSPIRIPLTFDR